MDFAAYARLADRVVELHALVKAKRAKIGERRKRRDGWYTKTADGWRKDPKKPRAPVVTRRMTDPETGRVATEMRDPSTGLVDRRVHDPATGMTVGTFHVESVDDSDMVTLGEPDVEDQPMPSWAASDPEVQHHLGRIAHHKREELATGDIQHRWALNAHRAALTANLGNAWHYEDARSTADRTSRAADVGTQMERHYASEARRRARISDAQMSIPANTRVRVRSTGAIGFTVGKVTNSGTVDVWAPVGVPEHQHRGEVQHMRIEDFEVAPRVKADR